MRILVVGSGGREHALVWKLKQSPRVTEIFCAPGNGGIAELATCVPIAADDADRLAAFAKERHIDLTVIGPEIPLLLGIVDRFEQEGLKVFGPRRKAALIEGSKRFAKELMQKYHIPTASFDSFTQAEEAKAYVRAQKMPIVIKADGLAAGKGVIIAQTVAEAEQVLTEVMERKVFGDAGNEVVIEEFLRGQEVSLMAFLDGKTVKPMVVAQDHKPVFDQDQGPNTGGMGTYSPVPQISMDIVEQAVHTILWPMQKALSEEGIEYKGVLYAGLMITAEGPKVIEFNARFGDPETQVVLPRLKTDLVDVIEAVLAGRLDQQILTWSEKAAVCVVMAAGGYPGSYEKGQAIRGLDQLLDGVVVFHAGTKRQGSKVVTDGGRVLGVTALAASLKEARDQAYRQLETISFKDRHYRTDIAGKALAHKKPIHE